MIAAGVRKFACGISPASNATTVRQQPDGTVLRDFDLMSDKL